MEHKAGLLRGKAPTEQRLITGAKMVDGNQDSYSEYRSTSNGAYVTWLLENPTDIDRLLFKAIRYNPSYGCSITFYRADNTQAGQYNIGSNLPSNSEIITLPQVMTQVSKVTVGGRDFRVYEVELYRKIINICFLQNKGEFKKWNEEIAEWQTVSATLPSMDLFQAEGMNSLSVLDRKIQNALKSPEGMIDEVLDVGRVLKETVDLKKYFDLKKLEVKLRQGFRID